MTSATRLRRVREVHRARSGGNTPGATPYMVYLVVMLTLIVAVPLLRLVVLGLAQPGALAILCASGGPVVLGVIVGVLFAGMVFLGRVRGPVLLSPFLTAVVAGNDLPRRRTLWRSFLGSTLVLVGVVLGSAVLVAGVLVTAGAASVLSAVVFVTGLLLVAGLAGVAWLIGQRLSSRSGNILAAVLVTVTVVTTVIPGVQVITPWGWVAALYPTSAAMPAAGLALVAFVVIVLVAALVVPRLLDGLNGTMLGAQARRWQTVGTFGATGDLASALAQFRALPYTGRTWGAVRARPLGVTFFVRDLLGSLRTPVRFASAAVALAGAGFLLVIAFAAPSTVMWLPTLVGAVLGYLALGVWSDGFRHAVEAAGVTSLYGIGDGRLLLFHAALPILCVLIFAGIGGVAAVTVGAPLLGLLVSITLLLFTVSVRAFDSVKGPMPLALLVPAPTPFGDFSGLLIAYWQADALIITGTVAITLTLAVVSAPLWLGALVPAAAAMLYLTRRKLARL